MQPELGWQLRSPWACKLLLAGEEWDGWAKEIIWGEAPGEEGAGAGCTLNAGAAYRWSPGRQSHSGERGQPACGLAGSAQVELGPLGCEERAGQIAQ